MGRYKRCVKPVLAIAGFSVIAGCGSSLETGYAYRPLGASSAERRGYYASPFTPEAAAAPQQTRYDPASELHSGRSPVEGPR